MSSVILGVPLEDVTNAGALDVIGELIADGRESGRTHQVTTVNVDFIVNAMHSASLLSILQGSSLNLADGAPVVWTSSKFGHQLCERVAGADLFEQLASASAQRGWRIHVLGGADGVGDRAVSILTERYPGAQVTADPGPIITDPTDVADAVLDDIARRDPDVLCVALGNPKQEYFIAAHRERMGCPVMIGVGGSMDMLVGDRHRAPRWVQTVGAEWIFRAAQEPRRLLPRYLADLRAVAPSVVRQRRKIRRYESTGSDLEVTIGEDGILASAVSADRDTGPADSTPGSTTDVVRLRLPVCIDLNGCQALSPQGHAMFWSLVRSAHRYGLPVRIEGWSEELADCFDRYLTKGWVGDLLAKSAGIQPHDEEKTPRFDTEFALRPIEKK